MPCEFKTQDSYLIAYNLMQQGGWNAPRQGQGQPQGQGQGQRPPVQGQGQPMRNPNQNQPKQQGNNFDFHHISEMPSKYPREEIP